MDEDEDEDEDGGITDVSAVVIRWRCRCGAGTPVKPAATSTRRLILAARECWPAPDNNNLLENMLLIDNMFLNEIGS